MAKHRITVRAPNARDKAALRSLLRAAGSRAELIKWIDRYLEPKMGRPRKNYFEDVSISDGPKGLKIVRFSKGSTNYVVVVDPKPRTPKPRLLKYEKTQPTIRKIVETLGGAGSSRADANATRWLIRELRKIAKSNQPYMD
jgi:hypothetical protein